MGVVYRARQLDLDRDVAIKVIAPELVEEPQARDRFLMEARAAAAVEHPNVLSIHSMGVEDGQAYLVMRFVVGDNLRTVVHRQGGLPALKAAEIALQLGDGLDAIHRAGYVHRDVKPQNVMLDESQRVYLTDFGLAKEALATTGPTSSDQWVGTLDYVAPEQIRGRRIDARADVYGLGGVLYFMLTAHVPFDRQGGEAKMWAHLSEDPPRPSAVRPDLPPALDEVVQRALAKDPDQRPPSAGDLGRAARDAATGSSTARRERMVAEGAAAPTEVLHPRAEATTVSTPRPGAVAAPERRRGGVLAAGALLAVAAVAGIGFLLGSDGDPQRPQPTAAPSPAPKEPAGPRVGQTIQGVGFRPRDLVVKSGDVWVISHSQAEVTRIDVKSGRRHGHQPAVGRGAASIAAHGNDIWVAVPRRGEVVRVDARSGAVQQRLPVSPPPARVAVGSSGLWIGSRSASPEIPDVLYRYDRAGEVQLGRFELGEGIGPMTLGGGYVWIGLKRLERIVRVSPGAGLEHAGWVIEPASALAYGGGHLWVSIGPDDSIARIDPATKLTLSRSAGQHPAQLAVVGRRVFVASTTDDTVVVVDSKTAKPTGKPLPVPPNPSAVAASGRKVWVTGIGDSTLTRIDL